MSLRSAPVKLWPGPREVKHQELSCNLETWAMLALKKSLDGDAYGVEITDYH
jgi:hypothetical protein